MNLELAWFLLPFTLCFGALAVDSPPGIDRDSWVDSQMRVYNTPELEIRLFGLGYVVDSYLKGRRDASPQLSHADPFPPGFFQRRQPGIEDRGIPTEFKNHKDAKFYQVFQKDVQVGEKATKELLDRLSHDALTLHHPEQWGPNREADNYVNTGLSAITPLIGLGSLWLNAYVESLSLDEKASQVRSDLLTMRPMKRRILEKVWEASWKDETVRDHIVDPEVIGLGGPSVRNSWEQNVAGEEIGIEQSRTKVKAAAGAKQETALQILDLQEKLLASQKAELRRRAAGNPYSDEEKKEAYAKRLQILKELNALSGKRIRAFREQEPQLPGASRPVRALAQAEVDAITDRSIARMYGALTLLIGEVDPKVARTVKAIGDGYADIAKAIHDFDEAQKSGQSGAGTGFAAGGVVGAVIGAAISIFSSLTAGPDIQEVILQQMVELRKEIEALRIQMHNRFDRVDLALNQIYGDMLKEFYRIELSLKNQSVDIHGIIEKLTLLQSVYLHHTNDVRELFSSISKQIRSAGAKRCLNLYRDYQVDKVEADFPGEVFAEFKACLDGLSDCATQDASSPLHAGTNSGASSEAEVLSRALLAPEREISALIRFADAYRFENVDNASPVNPEIYSDCAHAYVQTAYLFPVLFKKYVKPTSDEHGPNQLDRMIQTGLTTHSLLQSLTQGSKSNITAMKGLFKSYVQALSTVKKTLEARRTELRNQQLPGLAVNAQGLDPLISAPSQFVHKPHQPALATVCDPDAIFEAERANYKVTFREAKYSENTKYEIPFTIATAPKLFVVAQQLGLGEIRYCFGQVKVGPWAPAKELLHPAEYIDYKYGKQFSQVGGQPLQGAPYTTGSNFRYHTTLSATFALKGSKKSLPIFKRDYNMFLYYKDYTKQIPHALDGIDFDTIVWPSGQELLPSTDRDQAITAIGDLVEKELAVIDVNLRQTLAREIQTERPLQRADGVIVPANITELTTARNRLEAILLLGWPTSMRSDSLLRSLFRARGQLPQATTLAAGYIEQNRDDFRHSGGIFPATTWLESSLGMDRKTLDVEKMRARLSEIEKLVKENPALGPVLELETSRVIQSLLDAVEIKEQILPYVRQRGLLLEENLKAAQEDLGLSKDTLEALENQARLTSLEMTGETYLALKLLILHHKLLHELPTVPTRGNHPLIVKAVTELALFKRALLAESFAFEPPKAAQGKKP